MKSFTLAAVILLAACNRDEPPAPSSAQHDQLDEAEDMLDSLNADDGVGTSVNNASQAAETP